MLKASPSFLSRRFLRRFTLAALCGSFGGLPLSATAGETVWARESVFVGEYDPESADFLWLHEANNLIGSGALYGMGYWGMNARIANVEGGMVWYEHEVFRQRQEGVPVSIAPGVTIIYTPATFDQNSSVPYEPETAPAAGQISSHATAVAAMLGGLSMNAGGDLLIWGTGIAPLAELQSGGIAVSYNPEDPGSFSINKASFLKPYVDYFTGGASGTLKMDVINSSWGYADATGREEIYAGLIDGLARENPDVAFVGAAGNSGWDAVPGSPAAGFNAISVGALTHTNVQTDAFLLPAEFTSGSPLDFYNPQTGETISGVRAGVHVAAPGTNMVLAAYDETQPEATNLYYVNAGGTSFAAPMVSGGIALLKEMVKDQLPGNTDALDTRVVRSILMAGADRTAGWDNGQIESGDGVIRTSQSLDFRVGAGLVDLEESAAIYLNPQEASQTNLTYQGWDLNTVAEGQFVDYSLAFSEDPIELTLSLNWFVATEFVEATEEYRDLWFANLNLSLWLLGETPTLIAESVSLYNNSEFLRITLEGNAQYGIRVSHLGLIFDTTGAPDQEETYALAWSAEVIPEPSAWIFVSVSLLFVYKARGRADNLSA